jgi:hypothetical protein
MTGKERIESGKWAKCYICEEVFKRKRKTKRYCNQCEGAVCEGEHLTFQGRKIAICIQCYDFPEISQRKSQHG